MPAQEQADPNKAADAEADKWREKWGADNEAEIERTRRAIKELRQRLIQQGKTKYQKKTPQEWRRIAKTFSKRTALGVDNFSFRLFANLPDAALEEFDEVARQIVEGLAWPPQILVALLALLPKKSGRHEDDRHPLYSVPPHPRLLRAGL